MQAQLYVGNSKLFCFVVPKLNAVFYGKTKKENGFLK